MAGLAVSVLETLAHSLPSGTSFQTGNWGWRAGDPFCEWRHQTWTCFAMCRHMTLDDSLAIEE